MSPFLLLLIAVLAGATAHFFLGAGGSRRRAGEILLLWMLVGYCGVPMAGLALWGLFQPAALAAYLGFTPGHPFQPFLMVAYLGMAVVAVGSLRFRDGFATAAAFQWCLFFLGATVIHLHVPGAPGHDAVLYILATHTAVSALLAVALLLRLGVGDGRSYLG